MPSAKLVNRGGFLAVDTNAGNGIAIPMADNEPLRAYYGGAVSFVTTAAVTDILMIRGAAGKVVRVKNILLSGVNTSNASTFVTLNRRSTASTLGSITALPLSPRDTTDDAAGSAVSYFPGAATPGTAVGSAIEGYRLILPSNPVNTALTLFQCTWQNDKAYTLRGVNDFLCLSAVSIPVGATIDITVGLVEDTEPS